MRVRSIAAFMIALCTLCIAPLACPQGFKFSQPDESDRLEQEAREDRIADQLSTPCRAELKNKKIMVVIGQRNSDGLISAQQQRYSPHFQAINSRLRRLGLRTYTAEEIRRQIAQAQID